MQSESADQSAEYCALSVFDATHHQARLRYIWTVTSDLHALSVSSFAKDPSPWPDLGSHQADAISVVPELPQR